MSGEKDEEIMAPMFPRLHVNRAEKAGPKAPPRNKMALYEQFSIPSQRFKSKISMPTSKNVSDQEGNLPLHEFSLTHTHHAEKYDAALSDEENGNIFLTQLDQGKNFGHETDFMVPEFIPPSSEGSGRSSEFQNGCDKLRPEVMTKGNDENEQSQTYSAKIAFNLSGEEEIDALMREENESLGQTFQDKPTGISSLNQRKHKKRVFESANQKKNIVLQPTGDSRSWKNINDLKEIANESGVSVVRTKGTQQLEDIEKSETVSETSTVDSVSGFAIAPDDIVGILGQKNFWKARRAMANQQKVFAVQLFELHRLIKVQQLMAGSPHLLLEDRAPQASSSLKACSSDIFPSKSLAKPETQIGDKILSNKTTRKFEISAENKVGKKSWTSLSSKKTSPGEPYSEIPKTGDWGFHLPPGHQWLVPVMSPSEGLVYKPFSAPGLASTWSMMNPAYGIPCNPHYRMPFINSSPSGSAIEGKVVRSELRPSTTGSPLERGRGGRKDMISKGKELLPLFHAAPVMEEPKQVIRVVPHSQTHATKSAARIFRSIQQERKMVDNVRAG